MTTPTNENQLMLELINRARANPQAEVDLYPALGGDLNEGITTDLISADPKQPLAWNENLADAAVGHTQDMFDNDFFAHTNPITGSTPGTRATVAGYSGFAGENIAVNVSTGPIDLATATSSHHENLFIDIPFPGRGHRQAILDENYREIGLGTQLGTNYQGPFSREWNYAAITTQLYGDPFNSNPFLTGVVFTDGIINDNFYTIGEGLGGATIRVYDASGTSLIDSTVTYSSGGYQLQLAAGTYDITVVTDFDNDGVDEIASADNVVIGSDNVKVDFTSAIASEIPTPTPAPTLHRIPPQPLRRIQPLHPPLPLILIQHLGPIQLQLRHPRLSQFPNLHLDKLQG